MRRVENDEGLRSRCGDALWPRGQRFGLSGKSRPRGGGGDRPRLIGGGAFGAPEVFLFRRRSLRVKERSCLEDDDSGRVE